MNKVIIGLVIIVLIIIGVVLVRDQGSQEIDSQTGEVMIDESSEMETGDTDGKMMEDGVMSIKDITVEGKEFSFSPTEIEALEGDVVRVTFKNVGKFPHDFVIDEFSVATKVLQPGEEEIVEFTANKIGTFEYYCSIGSHREQGMFGKLIIN